MLSVLHDIKFFQPVLMAKVIGKSQRDTKQLECLKHFIDEAMARNSTRGRQAKSPMVYEELLSLARASANLIYSGTGVGLDWQVDHGTCSIDPYTLGDSSVSSGNARAAEVVATPRGGAWWWRWSRGTWWWWWRSRKRGRSCGEQHLACWRWCGGCRWRPHWPTLHGVEPGELSLLERVQVPPQMQRQVVQWLHLPAGAQGQRSQMISLNERKCWNVYYQFFNFNKHSRR